MKRFFLVLISFISLAVYAQTSDAVVAQADTVGQSKNCMMKFGCLSYDAALKSMPEYAVAQKNIQDLKAKYDAEMKRVEKEFNKKYENFLDGLSEFPPTIMKKRQAELQEMLTKNIAFKNESKRLLASAEAEVMAPLHKKLAELLKIIGNDRGFAFIINTDNNACPFVNPAQGEDINDIVKTTLQGK